MGESGKGPQGRDLMRASRYWSVREPSRRRWTRRRLLSVGTAATAGVVAACQMPGTSPVPAQETREVTVSFVTDWASGARAEYMKRAPAKFTEENPKINIRVDNWQGEVGVVALANAAAGTLQDVMLNLNDVFITLARGGGMKEITSVLKSQRVSMSDLVELPSTYVYEGKQYGMPFQFFVFSMVVNKTLFARAGVPLPAKSTTFPQLLDAARRLTRAEENVWGYRCNGQLGNWGEWLPFVWGYGGERWTPDFRRSLIGEPGSVEGLQFYVDLMHRHRVAPMLNDAGNNPSDVTFANGNVAVGNVSTPGAGLDTTIAGKFDWDVMYMPLGPRTNKRSLFANNQSTIVTASAVRNGVFEQAAKFSIWLAASKSAQDLIVELGPNTMPVLKSVFNGPRYHAGPPANIKILPEMLPDFRDPSVFIGWNDWRNAVITALRPAFAGKKAVNEAAADAARAGDVVLAKIPR
jgi:multiple sugar transport system substrate-binding protein